MTIWSQSWRIIKTNELCHFRFWNLNKIKATWTRQFYLKVVWVLFCCLQRVGGEGMQGDQESKGSWYWDSKIFNPLPPNTYALAYVKQTNLKNTDNKMSWSASNKLQELWDSMVRWCAIILSHTFILLSWSTLDAGAAKAYKQLAWRQGFYNQANPDWTASTMDASGSLSKGQRP